MKLTQTRRAPAVTLFAIAWLCAACLALTSCSNKPTTSPLVGRWREVGTAGLIVFHEEGTVEVALASSVISGKYTEIADGKLKLELIGKDAPLGPRVFQFTIVGDRMTLTDLTGQKTDYLRETAAPGPPANAAPPAGSARP